VLKRDRTAPPEARRRQSPTQPHTRPALIDPPSLIDRKHRSLTVPAHASPDPATERRPGPTLLGDSVVRPTHPARRHPARPVAPGRSGPTLNVNVAVLATERDGGKAPADTAASASATGASGPAQPGDLSGLQALG
jgi:hypothetical protein